MMIKALWLLGTAALVLAAFVLGLCVRGQWQADSHCEEIAASSAIDRFKQLIAGDTPKNRQESPLVREAQAFSLHLNPPRVARQEIVAPKAPVQDAATPMLETKPVARLAAEVKPASAPSPKFELHGICYNRSRPEQSMALVCEPASGRRWIRAGTQLGHIVIEQIRADSIVYDDGQSTHQMALASSETLTKYAQRQDTEPAPKGSDRRPQVVAKQQPAAVPPAMKRGIRQMPAARVAAKRGLPLTEVGLPVGSTTQSQ